MKIAILGGSGMIGSHTVRAALALGHEVRVVHRKSSNLGDLKELNIETAVGDLNEEASLRLAFVGVDAVIHSAGYYPPPVPKSCSEETQIASTQMKRFFSACAGLPLKKIVFIGSVVALPKHPEGKPATEELEYKGPPSSRVPYLHVKYELDRFARDKAKEGFPVVVGIPGMCLGEYDQGPTTGRIVVELLNGKLPAYVKGRRNVIYSGDAGRGMVLACEKGRIGERYLFTGTNITLDNLTQKIASLGNVPPPKFGIPPEIAKVLAKCLEAKYRWIGGKEPILNTTAIAVSSGQFLSGEKAEKELGYRPHVSLDEAIVRAIQWFKKSGYIHN